MSTERRCKIDAAVERYEVGAKRDGFADVHEELLALWKGEAERDALGYRSLAEWFNKQLLRSVYDANNRLTLGTRFDNEYEILTGDDDIARGELLDELAQAGIDGQQVSDDMVSFSTIRRHLTDCLDGKKERQQSETNWEETSVEIATDTLLEKVDKALSSYETKEEIAGATEAEVSVQVQLSCPHCPTRRTLNDALRNGYVCEDHLGSGPEE